VLQWNCLRITARKLLPTEEECHTVFLSNNLSETQVSCWIEDWCKVNEFHCSQIPRRFQTQVLSFFRKICSDNPKFHFDRYQLFIVKLVESKVMNMNQSFMEPIE
jgi:hypothetical protein